MATTLRELETRIDEKGFKTQEVMVNMGPQHPSTHGVLRLLLRLDGEVVMECQPHLGYLHRCHEKIAENRHYPEFIVFSDRMDYVAAMNNNLGYCMAVEKLMSMEVPERGQYVRVIIAEMNRIASHLLWWATFALDLGAFTPFLYAFREREKILDIFEKACGARLTYSYMRIGGASNDLSDELLKQIQDFLVYFKPKLKEYDDLLTANPILVARLKGIGILKKEEAFNFGATGPMLRGSGVEWDLRKTESYLVYDKLSFSVCVEQEGDCFARYKVRMRELEESIKIVEQCLKKIPSGTVMARAPKVYKPPAGEYFDRSECPRGELGFYIVSDGSDKPYRIKVRPPTFVNLSILPHLARGHKIADVVAILGSIDIVIGEVDR